MRNKCPYFMHLDWSLVESINDLYFQVSLEIDLAESGEIEWTSAQMQKAKVFQTIVKGLDIAAQGA